MIETKKQTFEKENYQTGEVLKEEKYGEDSYQIGYVEGVEEVLETEKNIDHNKQCEINNVHEISVFQENKDKQDNEKTFLQYSSILAEKNKRFEANIFRQKNKTKKGPFWQYFTEDVINFNFVYCRTCHSRLSRGLIGTPRSQLRTSCMTAHLKIHKELWHEYQAIKIEIDTKECEEKIHRTKEIKEKVHRKKKLRILSIS